jgi:hypothetical protein
MAENKTKQTEASVEDFLNGVADEQQRQDAFKLLALMQQITKTEPKMWGPSIVGFGKVHYKYASGREGDMGLAGFSPRKGNLTIYLSPGTEAYGPLLAKLGKHKTGKVCLYIKRLDDVHLPTLKELVRQSVKFNKQLPKT